MTTTEKELYATFGARLGAWVLDALVSASSTFLFLAISYYVSESGYVHARDLSFFFGIFGVLVMPVVLVVMTGISGQTFGASAMGIRVVDAKSSEPIGIARAIGRHLFASFISGPILLLGYLAMLWDPKNRAWHDVALGSVVIREDAVNRTDDTASESTLPAPQAEDRGKPATAASSATEKKVSYDMRSLTDAGIKNLEAGLQQNGISFTWERCSLLVGKEHESVTDKLAEWLVRPLHTGEIDI